MYHYLVCLQLGIVWVVLSGVRRLDEMTVTTGLGSESRLAVLAGRIRSEILSQPATPHQSGQRIPGAAETTETCISAVGRCGLGRCKAGRMGRCVLPEGPEWIDWFPQEWARLGCTSSRNWKATHGS